MAQQTLIIIMAVRLIYIGDITRDNCHSVGGTLTIP
jgi:hypothetical protein